MDDLGLAVREPITIISMSRSEVIEHAIIRFAGESGVGDAARLPFDGDLVDARRVFGLAGAAAMSRVFLEGFRARLVASMRLASGTSRGAIPTQCSSLNLAVQFIRSWANQSTCQTGRRAWRIQIHACIAPRKKRKFRGRRSHIHVTCV